MTTAIAPSAAGIKLDLGCGTRKREGFTGVDRIPFDGAVDVVHDLSITPWPWDDGSVTEAHCSHFVEHLSSVQRVAFVNELYRVLVPGGQCQIIVPHWASNRAYGDPTHQWPPVSEMWFMYLSRDWRKDQAPHTDVVNWPKGFDCNFQATWGYGMRPDLVVRNQEYQQYAMQNHKEAITDMMAMLTKVA